MSRQRSKAHERAEKNDVVVANVVGLQLIEDAYFDLPTGTRDDRENLRHAHGGTFRDEGEIALPAVCREGWIARQEGTQVFAAVDFRVPDGDRAAGLRVGLCI